MNLQLAQAVRVNGSACVAFAGAGGKTTAMFQLARLLTPPVIVTATSHLGVWQINLADQHILTDQHSLSETVAHQLQGVTLITGDLDGDRTTPVSKELLNWLQLFCRSHSLPLLIEADGSRGKPLKAWAEHEPPIPAFVETVIQVAGLSALGEPMSEKNVHRPEVFVQRSGLSLGETISPGAIRAVLTHPQGGLKNIPTHARKIALLNQADTADLQAAARVVAQSIIPPYQAAVIASLEGGTIHAVHERIAGVVLAAGGSTRFGQPKQLLDWKGQPFVRSVASTALDASLSPVIIVTGSNARQVTRSVEDLPVIIMRNDEWESGQASSIKAGLLALSDPSLSAASPVGGAVFLLTDQPQVTTAILRALVERHAQGLYPIVAPMVIDRRANPVLFDQATFADLLSLEGDVGGRAIFHKHHVEYLPWHDDRLLLDVDTPEMYQRLISDENI
jgi:molybdenum cofactor cytidylyltransferase